MINKLFKNKTNNTFIQLFRYTFVGGIAASVDIGSFGVFIKIFSIDYRLAIFFSFTLGTLTNFVICNYFVFERKSLTIVRACVRHYLSSIGGLIMNELVMILLVEVINIKYMMISKIIATGSAFLVNFTLIKFYAFNGNFNLRSKIKKEQR